MKKQQAVISNFVAFSQYLNFTSKSTQKYIIGIQMNAKQVDSNKKQETRQNHEFFIKFNEIKKYTLHQNGGPFHHCRLRSTTPHFSWRFQAHQARFGRIPSYPEFGEVGKSLDFFPGFSLGSRRKLLCLQEKTKSSKIILSRF